MISGISLRAALKLMLEDVNGTELAYIIEDEVMKITTRDKADTIQQVRVYPVADLVISPVIQPQIAQSVAGQAGGGAGAVAWAVLAAAAPRAAAALAAVARAALAAAAPRAAAAVASSPSRIPARPR